MRTNWIPAALLLLGGCFGESRNGASPVAPQGEAKTTAATSPKAGTAEIAADPTPVANDAAAAIAPDLDRVLEAKALVRRLPTYVAALKHPNPKARTQAIHQIAGLEKRASPALAALLATARNDPVSDVRTSALYAVPKVAKDADSCLPALIELLEDADDFVAGYAAYALGELGPAAEKAIPPLRAALEHERRRELRRRAAQSMGTMGPAAKEAVPLLKKLAVPFGCRREATIALANLGERAALSELLDHEEISVREAAADSLRFVTPVDDAVVALLAKAMRDPEKSVRETVISNLQVIEPPTAKVIPLLVAALGAKEREVEERIQRGLIHCPAAETFAALLPLLAEPHESAVAILRGQLQRLGDEAVPTMMAATNDPLARRTLLAAALPAFQQVQRKELEPVVRPLRSVMFDKQQSLEVRGYAAVSLSSHWSDDEHVQAVLIESLEKSAHNPLRIEAARALGKVKSQAAAPALVAAIRTKSGDLTAVATEALMEAGAAADAVPALLEAVKDRKLARPGPLVWALASVDSEPARQAVLAALADERMEVRRSAAEALEQVETRAKGAIPQLVAACRDKEPNVRAAAVLALRKVGPGDKQAALAAAQAIGDTDADVRAYAIETFGTIGVGAGESATVLIDLLSVGLNGENAKKLPGAARSLGAIGPAAKDAAPPLLKLLSHDDPNVREAAAHGLGGIGLGARAAVAKLTELLGADRESSVRARAAVALVQIAPADDNVQAAIARALQDDRAGESIVSALIHLGPRSVPVLSRALREAELEARERIVASLVYLQDDQARWSLAKIALADKEPKIRWRAAAAAISADADESVLAPVLVDALRSDNADLRRDVPRLLSSLSPSRAKALASVLANPKESEQVRLQSLQVLKAGRIPDPVTLSIVRQALLKALGDESKEVRLRAALRLEELHGTPTEAVPVLVEALRHSDKDTRREAASALASLGAGARKAVPELIAALQDPENLVSSYAADALLEIGVAESDLPALRKLLADAHTDHVAKVIGSLREKAAPAVPDLIALLEDDEPYFHLWLARSLGAIGRSALAPLRAVLEDADASPAKVANACEAIAHLGAAGRDAGPQLAKLFAHSDANVRLFAAATAARLSLDLPGVGSALAPGLKRRSIFGDFEAREIFEAVAPLGRDALPALREGLQKEQGATRAAMIHVLARLEEPSAAVPALMAILLDDPQYGAYASAWHGLAWLGKPAVPALLRAIEAERADPEPRWQMLEILAKIGPAAAETEQPLRKLLPGADRRTATWLAIALANIAPPRADLAPHLLAGVRSSESDLSEQSLAALAKLGPQAKDAMPDILKLVETKRFEDMAPVLRSLGPAAEKCLPAILSGLDRSPDEFRGAATVLAAIGPAAKSAAPRLYAKFQAAKYPDERELLLKALAATGADLSEARDVLLRELEDPARRHGAVLLLGHLTPLAKEIAPVLRKALKDEELAFRVAAATALAQCGPAAGEAVPDLLAALDDEPLRRAAIEALGAIGPAAAPAVPRLASLLESGRRDERRAAIVALGRIGQPHETVIAGLIRLLDDRQLDYEAMKALGQLGLAAKAAVPKLIDKSLDPMVFLRYRAQEALRKIDPAP